MKMKTTILACSLWTLLAAGHFAEAGVWQNINTGDWSDPANWTGGVPNGPGDVATFAQPFPADTGTITIDGEVRVGTIESLNENSIYLDGTGKLVMDAADNGQAELRLHADAHLIGILTDVAVAPGDDLLIDVATGAALQLRGLFDGGTATVTKTGPGRLILIESAATWTGPLDVSGGTVEIYDAGSLGSTAGETRIATGGTLAIGPNVSPGAEPIVLDGGTLAALEEGVVTFTGPVELRSTGTLQNETDTVLRFNGPIGGTGGVTLDGGKVEFNAANTYTGDVRVSNGELFVTHAQALGDPGGSTTIETGGTLRLGTVDITAEPIVLAGGVIEGPTGATATFGGTLSGTGTSTIARGTIRLTGENNFSGTMHLTSGARLTGASNTALGSAGANTIVHSGAKLFVAGGTELSGGKITLSGGSLNIAPAAPANPTVYSEIELAESTRSQMHSDQRRTFFLRGPITGSGDVAFASSYDGYNAFYLYGENTYTGETYLDTEDTSVRVYHPSGLGSPEAGTVVRAGGLLFEVPASEPIEVLSGGTMYLPDTAEPYLGPCVLRGGSLEVNDDHGVLEPTLVIDGGTVGNERSGNRLTLKGGITGKRTLTVLTWSNEDRDTIIEGTVDHSGDFLAFGTIRLTGRLAHRGDLIVGNPFDEWSKGDLTLEADVAQYEGATFIRSGTLDVGEDNTLSTVVLDRRGDHKVRQARIHVNFGATLTIEDEFRFYGGYVDGNLRGLAEIVKTTRANGGFARLGEDFDGPITVYGGELITHDDTGLGSSVGSTTIAVSENAALSIDYDARVIEDVYLNNATGIEHQGALYGNYDRWDMGELGGNLFLGDRGSCIGDNVVISAAIHGGALTKVVRSGGELVISGGGHTYTGPTTISRGEFVLRNQGRLASTASIDVRGNGELVLDNAGEGQLPDRVADHLPVSLNSGTVHLIGAEGLASSETLGSVAAETGIAHLIVASGEEAGSSAALTVDSLTRRPGSVVKFETSGNQAQIHLPATELHHNLIGGWAMFVADKLETDFATIGPEGVVPYSDLHAYVTDLGAAGPGDNVRLDADATLNGNRTINAMLVPFDQSGRTLNLAGATLNLGSGGLLNASTLVLANGRLTAGGDAPGELMLSGGNLTVEADIVDNPEPVDLTVSRNYEADVFLRGTNTYSGKTTINNATLHVESREALPQGTPLDLNNYGKLRIDFADGNPVYLGPITVRSGGRVYGQADSPVVADAYLIEDGKIEHLAGTGPLVKTTPGRGTVSDASQYFGPITVEHGMLTVEGALSAPAQSGQGTITVRQGGIFSAVSNSIARNLVLDGGTFHGLDGFNMPIEVTRRGTIGKVPADKDSGARGKITGEADLVLDGEFYQDYWDDESRFYNDLNDFGGDLHVTGGQVALLNDNRNYQGDVFVTAHRLAVRHKYALGSGTTYVLPEGTLAARTTVDASIELAGGKLYPMRKQMTLVQMLPVTKNSWLEIMRTSAKIDLSGGALLADGVTLTKHGEGELIVRSNLLLGGDNSIVALDGQTRILGTVVADGPSCRLDMVGQDTFVLDASIRVPADKELALEFNGTNASLDVQGSDKSVAGGGTLRSDLTVTGGAVLRPGESAGTLTVDGDLTLGAMAAYEWEMRNAAGVGGSHDGWDLLHVLGALNVAADGASPGELRVVGLAENGSPGAVDGFDPQQNYRWTVASADAIVGFDRAALNIDATGFVQHNPIAPLGEFSLQQHGGDLMLAYTVPEPGTWALLAVGVAVAVGAGLLRRRRGAGWGR
ncbi:MAG: autotransporter-associated beta strand repeat-containing protein [Candidatus Nealsonbacteria bacterium]|nr:autotransporter-associated beta strand repeat-containing protein [Candidatus Nealsonbacteria bacterium]